MTVSFEFTACLKFYPDGADPYVDVPTRVVPRGPNGRETDMECPVCLERPAHLYSEGVPGIVNQWGECVFNEPYDDDCGMCRECDSIINIDHVRELRLTIRK